MKIIITILIYIACLQYFLNLAAIDELSLKLQLSAKTEIAQKKLIKSLQRNLNFHIEDMKSYHRKRGTTVNEVACDEIKNFMIGVPSVFTLIKD